jgi:hypothetical protein
LPGLLPGAQRQQQRRALGTLLGCIGSNTLWEFEPDFPDAKQDKLRHTEYCRFGSGRFRYFVQSCSLPFDDAARLKF